MNIKVNNLMFVFLLYALISCRYNASRTNRSPGGAPPSPPPSPPPGPPRVPPPDLGGVGTGIDNFFRRLRGGGNSLNSLNDLDISMDLNYPELKSLINRTADSLGGLFEFVAERINELPPLPNISPALQARIGLFITNSAMVVGQAITGGVRVGVWTGNKLYNTADVVGTGCYNSADFVSNLQVFENDLLGNSIQKVVDAVNNPPAAVPVAPVARPNIWHNKHFRRWVYIIVSVLILYFLRYIGKILRAWYNPLEVERVLSSNTKIIVNNTVAKSLCNETISKLTNFNKAALVTSSMLGSGLVYSYYHFMDSVSKNNNSYNKVTTSTTDKLIPIVKSVQTVQKYRNFGTKIGPVEIISAVSVLSVLVGLLLIFVL
jgi:hypothetical protein